MTNYWNIFCPICGKDTPHQAEDAASKAICTESNEHKADKIAAFDFFLPKYEPAIPGYDKIQ